MLIADLLNLKSVIADINTQKHSFESAKSLLFGETLDKSISFYDAGMCLVDESTNGKLYATVLKSFNTAFPGIGAEDITKATAVAYMNALLKTNRPNGVHAYMRTLNAIFNKVANDVTNNPFKGVRPKKELLRYLSGTTACSREHVVGVHNDIANGTTLPDIFKHPFELFTFIALGRFVSPTKIP